MSRVRGGINSISIRVSCDEVTAFVKNIDILIPFEKTAFLHLKDRISDEIIIIGDKKRLENDKVIDVSFQKIASDFGNALYANSVAVGLVSGLNDVKINDTPFWDNVKSIFAEWKNNKNKFNFDISQADLYRKALDIEKKSIDFYTEKSKVVKDVKQKQLLLKIANEEKSHYKVMENIIEFITMPDRWVENAEFNIGEEY
jgi:hypothetical protein